MFVFGVVLMKAFVLTGTLIALLNGSEYSVVVSKNTPFSSLSRGQIKDLFLQKRHTINEFQIVPVNVLGHDDARTAFEAKVLEMDRSRLNAYWIKQHFQGVMPPLTQPSFESIKAFVENVDGAIGYLPSNMVDSKVRVVYEF